jgi:hypothetical protein
VEIPDRRIERIETLDRRCGALHALAVERNELLVEVRVRALEEQDESIAVNGGVHYDLLGGHVRTGR